MLCNNNAIFYKFRTWMDEELNSAVKVLKKNLFLLDPSLTITPKQEGPPVSAYGMEPLRSPVQDIQVFEKRLCVFRALS